MEEAPLYLGVIIFSLGWGLHPDGLKTLSKEQVAVMAKRFLLNFLLCSTYALSWMKKLFFQSFMPWSSHIQTTAIHFTWGYS